MDFVIIERGARVPERSDAAYLMKDHWDDWFKFETQFTLIYRDRKGEKHTIGEVKIGQADMAAEQRTPDLDGQFTELDERFFSLGQDATYYENLSRLGDTVRSTILTALRDVAVDQELFQRMRLESVMQVSLLRSVTPAEVQGQFARVARGYARLTPFEFAYETPGGDGSPPVRIEVNVEPESHPPTNIHVIVGRNGVGKTHLLHHMTRALLNLRLGKRTGRFAAAEEQAIDELFANLVSVTFSAFDPFEPIPSGAQRGGALPYTYVGLRRPVGADKKPRPPKSTRVLGTEFVNSVRECRVGSRVHRWRRALQTLETDPLFAEADVASLAHESTEDWKPRARKLFDKLSSGHKIVILTMTRLVELVEERTLVLLDEPEAHLHPPLLSAMVRALSDLLNERNGVAIVATHSPVVLQEVPRTCIWMLRRSGHELRAERPEIETFGENVGVLTREAFGYEVTQSGFHQLLAAAAEQEGEYELVMERFDDQLGSEARSLVRALTIAQDEE